MQKAFADYYLEKSNATDAAIRAGYSKKTAYSQGQRLLKNAEVKKYIDERLDTIKSDRIATIEEVMSFYTSVMRGKEKDQFGLDASLTDRLKAGQELIKRLTVADNSGTDKTTENMTALADLINNPQPNRNIADFEGDNDE
jgi:phage terminase small subunit